MAELVRTEREKRGWTLDDLAERSHLAKATLFRIEKGETLPRGATRRKLAAALDLDVAALRTAVDAAEHGDSPAASASDDVMRTLRRVWPELSTAQQMDLLRMALEMRRQRGSPDDAAKAAAS